MHTFLPSPLFLTTILLVFAVQITCSFIGYRLATLLPWRIRAIAKFYLSPAIGLATLVIFSSWYGKNFPFGQGYVVHLIWLAVMATCLIPEPEKKKLLVYSFYVGVFSCICGISLLAGLYVFEAYNFHNDGFTYLAHGNWLQENAFNEKILPPDVTPVTTQIALYQAEGFRMGGSYLLGLIQSLSQLKWSLDVYPSVVIVTIANSCIAIGFAIAALLRYFSRKQKFMLLTLPSFSLGGMVFSVSFGFLPQSLGVCLGAAFVYTYGAAINQIRANKTGFQDTVKLALLPMILFAGSVFAYSEFALFIISASGIYTVYKLATSQKPKLVIYFALTNLLIALVLLNVEIYRAYIAIITQSGVVVGSPVNWPLIGYVLHSIGVHGGAWDGAQFTLPDTSLTQQIVITPLYVLSIVVLVMGIWKIMRVKQSYLTPLFIIIVTHFLLIVYFRYGVNAPFAIGKGQSWSQFKLSDWLHPFMSVIMIAGLISLLGKTEKMKRGGLHTLVALGLLFASISGYHRANHLMKSYPNVSHLSTYLKGLPSFVSNACGDDVPIYLDLGGSYHKVRQIVALFLGDRSLKSNWYDDGYIFHQLIDENRNQNIQKADCVIQPADKLGYLSAGQQYGSLLIAAFSGQEKAFISSYRGSYDKESDGQNWWVWVPYEVSFDLESENVTSVGERSVLRFIYGAIIEQIITIKVVFADGSEQIFTRKAEHNSSSEFIEDLNGDITSVRQVTITSNGEPVTLSTNDPRKAVFIIRNLSLESF
jgi:hypothetical protein